jgi:hypothetical protein
MIVFTGVCAAKSPLEKAQDEVNTLTLAQFDDLEKKAAAGDQSAIAVVVLALQEADHALWRFEWNKAKLTDEETRVFERAWERFLDLQTTELFGELAALRISSTKRPGIPIMSCEQFTAETARLSDEHPDTLVAKAEQLLDPRCGIQKDRKSARALLRKAAHMGHENAVLDLYRELHAGNLDERAEADTMLYGAAEAGSIGAQLETLSKNFDSEPPNLASLTPDAMKTLERVAKENNSSIQCILGYVLDSKNELERALFWTHVSAMQNPDCIETHVEFEKKAAPELTKKADYEAEQWLINRLQSQIGVQLATRYLHTRGYEPAPLDFK